MCNLTLNRKNNNSLVNYLKDAGYIESASVEKIFRAVDRGEYFWFSPSPDAYKTNTLYEWRHFHILGPCVYAVTIEALKLETGMSFLSLGSGTGYMNTLAGLALGLTGINHGIELYKKIVEVARRRLDAFKRFSGAIDEFDFCEPQFVQGNFLALPEGCRQYDRVYCGVIVPLEKLDFLKKFVKVGGILVAPLSDVDLYKMTRLPGDNNWTEEFILESLFRFTRLLPEGSKEICRLPDVKPPSLQELSRVKINQVLRKSIEMDYPEEIVRKSREEEEKEEEEDEEEAEIEDDDELEDWTEEIAWAEIEWEDEDREPEEQEQEGQQEEEEEGEEEKVPTWKSKESRRMYKSLYTVHMKARIDQMPLPPRLREYLLYDRKLSS